MNRMMVYSAVLWAAVLSGSALADADANERAKTAQDGIGTLPVAFGQWVFGGQFAKDGFTGFNPNYRIAVGDVVSVQIWGRTSQGMTLTVDEQGNVFLPRIGPVRLLGVANKDLTPLINQRLATVYKEGVHAYANVDGAKPVKVYVTGFVQKAGLYHGHAADSVIHFLDKAQGISAGQGSYLDVKLLRDGRVIATYDLYDFIINGRMPDVQFHDGDTLKVGRLKNYALFDGLVQHPSLIEFSGEQRALTELLEVAGIRADATHARVTRQAGTEISVEYHDVHHLDGVLVSSGDLVTVVADKQHATLSVRVEGAHNGPQELIAPTGATLGDVLTRISFAGHADPKAIQLYRESVRKRQKEMLESNLVALESSILTARSQTSEAAALRKSEADLMLQWVERARAVEPVGQVVLAGAEAVNDIVLEPGDVIRVPKRSSIVMVHGEVLSPNAVAFSSRKSVLDYIDGAGGLNQDKGNKILLLHADGTFSRVESGELNEVYPVAGDEIMVLPRVDSKSVQIAKDFSEILYQIALSAGVILAL